MTTAMWGIAAGMAVMFGFALYRRSLWIESRPRPGPTR